MSANQTQLNWSTLYRLKRIKTHRRWLIQPPTYKPTRAEFGLPETLLLSTDILGAIEAVEREEAIG